MTQHSSLQAAAPFQPSRIAVLRCRDTFRIDPVPLHALFAGQSDEDAEAMINRALQDMAARLDRLQLARTTGQYDEIGGPARRIAVIAGGMGLTEVQSVANHVASAAETGSGVALSATLARLERCFDQAVSAIWDLRMQR